MDGDTSQGSDDEDMEDAEGELEDEEEEESDSSDGVKKSSSDSETKSVKQCHRCGKLLTVDFCLCVYKIPFQCERCHETFSSLLEFQTHMKSLHARNRQTEDSSPEDSSVPFDQEDPSYEFYPVSNGEAHACPVCKEVFNTKLGLMAHSLSHMEREETSMYKCNHCNREFTSTVRLSIHVTRMHIEEKKYICDVCNKGFRYTLCRFRYIACRFRYTAYRFTTYYPGLPKLKRILREGHPTSV